jgi:hypothetical protein
MMTDDRAYLLGEFLGLRRTFRYSVCDCATRLADWMMFCGYDDPAADFRDAYRTELEAARQLRRAGGFVPLIDRLAKRAGLAPAEGPFPVGAVGVIGNGRKLFHSFGAIHDGSSWIVFSPRGDVPVKARPLTAWVV